MATSGRGAAAQPLPQVLGALFGHGGKLIRYLHNQRIPYFGKAKALEVFPIGGREVGDVVMSQGQGEAYIVNAARGVTGAGVLPDLAHQSGAWVVEDEPGWILPEIVDFSDGFVGSQRVGANDGIAQQGVNLDQDQLAEGEVWVHHHGFQPSAGWAVARMGNL